MHKNLQLGKRIPSVFASLLTVLVAGLVLNAAYQARTAFNTLAPNAQIAVFVKRNMPEPSAAQVAAATAPVAGVVAAVAADTTTAAAVVPAVAENTGESLAAKLTHLDGVAEAVFISREKAFENAAAVNSPIKDIMLTGDNPFSPYYLLRSKEYTPEAVQKLQTEISALDGVDDVRYDPNLFSAVDRLERFARYYELALRIALICLVCIVIVRLTFSILFKRFDHWSLIFAAGGGLLSGLAGAGVYSYLSGAVSLLQMPGAAILQIVLSGLLVTLAWEN